MYAIEIIYIYIILYIIIYTYMHTYSYIHVSSESVLWRSVEYACVAPPLLGLHSVSNACIEIYLTYLIFNSLRHSPGPLAFGLQTQSTGCLKLVGVKVALSNKWCV